MSTLHTNFLHEGYQRVALNGKTSSWKQDKSGVPQGLVLNPLFFLTYINDLLDNLESNCKRFADDTSLFYKVLDKYVSAINMCNFKKDLELTNNWNFQWKMQFNPDRNNQAQELGFSIKLETKND